MFVEDKEKKNVECLREFRLNGEPVPVGTVLPKSVFGSKAIWMDLCVGEAPKLVQTDAKAGAAPKGKKSGGMPKAE